VGSAAREARGGREAPQGRRRVNPSPSEQATAEASRIVSTYGERSRPQSAWQGQAAVSGSVVISHYLRPESSDMACASRVEAGQTPEQPCVYLSVRPTRSAPGRCRRARNVASRVGDPQRTTAGRVHRRKASGRSLRRAIRAGIL